MTQNKRVFIIGQGYLCSYFTNDNHGELISLGLSGGYIPSCYVQIKGMDSGAVFSDWCRENVLPILSKNNDSNMSAESAKSKIVEWLNLLYADKLRTTEAQPSINPDVDFGLQVVSVLPVSEQLFNAIPGFKEAIGELPFTVQFVTLSQLGLGQAAAQQVGEYIDSFYCEALPKGFSLNGAIALGYGLKKAEALGVV